MAGSAAGNRASAQSEVNHLRIDLRKHVFPSIDVDALHELIRERRFVILQGPPGTGKTRLALQLRKEQFKASGSVIQFHPAVTYESFVAGISPDVAERTLRFIVKQGAACRSRRSGKGPGLSADYR